MEDQTRSLQRWMSIISAGIAILIVPFAILSTFTKKTTTEVRTAVIEVEFRDLEEQVKKLDQVTQRLNSSLQAVSATIDEATKNPQALNAAKLTADLGKVSKDVKSIQSALGSDLERSLSVPLLRKDLEQLRSQVHERTTAAPKEIDRIYDQNKWFLGLMGTMAIGLLGLAVSNFLQSRKEGS